MKHDFLWYAERMGVDADDCAVDRFIDYLLLNDLDVDDVFEGDDNEFNKRLMRCFNEQK